MWIYFQLSNIDGRVIWAVLVIFEPTDLERRDLKSDLVLIFSHISDVALQMALSIGQPVQ